MEGRAFTEEEEIIIDLIDMQRRQSKRKDEFFVYRLSRGQEVLDSNGQSTKYGIGPTKQLKIISKLVDDNILEADWVLNIIGSNITNDVNEKFELAYNDGEWLMENFCSETALFDDDAYADSVFISMGPDDIKAINARYRANLTCTLSFDGTSNRFIVTDKNGNRRVVNGIRSGLPFAVLKYAVNENPNKDTTRQILRDNGIPVGKKQIATKIFEKDTSVVYKELKPFVKDIDADLINIQTTVFLSQSQFEAIK